MPLTKADADLVVNTLLARPIWSTSHGAHGGNTPLEKIISRNYRNIGELITAYRAGKLTSQMLVDLNEDDFADIAKAVNDEAARRLKA